MRILHAGTELDLAPDRSAVFGRSREVDLQLECGPDDTTVSRRAGELAFATFAWKVTNIGRRAFFVVQRGAEHELAPGETAASSLLLVGDDAWIRVPAAAGDLALVLDIPEGERPTSQQLESQEQPAGTALERPVKLTDNELRSVLALYEGYLELPPRYRREPNSFRAAAHRLGVEEGKVKADLRRVQDKVSKAGGPAEGGSRYRDTLIQWLISRGSVKRRDLDLIR